MPGWYLPPPTWGEVTGDVLVAEFPGMTPNGLFCADALRPLDLVPLTDFTYKYYPGTCRCKYTATSTTNTA